MWKNKLPRGQEMSCHAIQLKRSASCIDTSERNLDLMLGSVLCSSWRAIFEGHSLFIHILSGRSGEQNSVDLWED